MSENLFHFICPMFNASSTLSDLLCSLLGQSYKNWKLTLIDDVSTVAERAHCSDIINAAQYMIVSAYDNINVIWNSGDNGRGKQWETSNVLYGIKRDVASPDDIVCRIDADDALCDLDALMIMDAAYKQTGCDAAWTMHRWGFSDRNISGQLQPGVSVYRQPWVTSHLKTFRRHLIDGVPYENFLNMNGDLVRRCGDQALYLPVIHRAKKPIFVPRPLYRYTIDEQGGAVYQTDDAKFQRDEAEYIRARGYVAEGQPWEERVS